MGILPYAFFFMMLICLLASSIWNQYAGQSLRQRAFEVRQERVIRSYNARAEQKMDRVKQITPADQTAQKGGPRTREQHAIRGKISLPRLFRETDPKIVQFLQRLLERVYGPFLNNQERQKLKDLASYLQKIDWKRPPTSWVQIWPSDPEMAHLFYRLLKGSCSDHEADPLQAPGLDTLFSLRINPYIFAVSEVDYAILEVYFENSAKIEKLREFEIREQKIATQSELTTLLGSDPVTQSRLRLVSAVSAK